MVVNLADTDRQQLIAILKDVEELQNEGSRLIMLRNAGLKERAAYINLAGSPYIAVSKIVQYLSDYGRLTYDREALGQFLNAIKFSVGPEQQEVIDRLLTEYQMMEPVVTSSNISKWLGIETPVTVQEKIIGENTLRPIAFLAQGFKVAQSVVYIGVRIGSGSGFMVAPNLVLTNNHVLPDAEAVKTALFRFNYEENFLGEAQQVFEYRAKVGGIFHTNKALDYTLVEVEGEPGKEWGYLPLAVKGIKPQERVNIIQHPAGQPKQISMQNNFVQYVGGNVIQYVTSTLPGSSGSPVFNDNWEVVGLHHSGGKIPEPTTGKRYYRNEGIWVGSILKDLPEELTKLLAN